MTDYPKNNVTREGIITNMCYTWDHAWGAPFQPFEEIFSGQEIPEHLKGKGFGTSPEEKKELWDRMAQIFDNDIAPHMTFKNEDPSTLPTDQALQEAFDAFERQSEEIEKRLDRLEKAHKQS
jgi:hypothetical protein